MSISDNADNTFAGDTHRRKPAVAVLLSLFCGGLGHIYCGRLGKGVALLTITTLIGPMVIAALLLGHTDWTFPTLIISFVVANLIWFYAIIDAFIIARRAPRDYQLKDYNRWYLYLLFILMIFPVGTSYALLVREGVCEAFIIPSKSMHPTIHQGDRVLVDKRAYRHTPVERGDIVVFFNPNQRERRWIKRVVALPGDVVEMKEGRLFINGEQLPRDEIDKADQNGGRIFEEKNGATSYRIFMAADDTKADLAPQDHPKTTIPPGHCFVLGDNRRKSKDSREVGPIPLADIIGRAVSVYFPRWESLK
ncbi:MAG: signal peptidase I [Pirellulales bacterium]|nr:signal peptidase I [Pirellulales bacterium]